MYDATAWKLVSILTSEKDLGLGFGGGWEGTRQMPALQQREHGVFFFFFSSATATDRGLFGLKCEIGLV